MTAVSKAFNIGKLESAAVSNLQANVEPFIVTKLKKCVSSRGMRTFLSHDVLGKGLFNTGYSSASGCSEPWVSVMTNTENGRLDARLCF